MEKEPYPPTGQQGAKEDAPPRVLAPASCDSQIRDDPEATMPRPSSTTEEISSVMLAPLVPSPPQEINPMINPERTNSLATAHEGSLLEQTLFFACGLGTSICYIATLSSLVYFKLEYGADSFVYLNLAVYLPLLPISLAQARWDQYYDGQYQSRRAFLVRGVLAFLLGLLGTVQMIRGHQNPHSGLGTMVMNAWLQGTGGAILYGTLNQLASFVGISGDGGRKLKTALSAGVQASALVVLAVSLLTGFGVHNAYRFSLFLWIISAVELLCLIFFLLLLLAQPAVAAAMTRRDSSLPVYDDGTEQNLSMATPLIVLSSTSNQPSSSTASIELSFVEIFQRSGSCCWILIGTLVPSFLVGSWFTRVQTNWMALASWLFYVRIASDLLGRLATILVPPRTLDGLTWTCLVRICPLILFFLNAHSATPLHVGLAADLLSIVLVAIISFLSGYLVTGCFQLAPFALEMQHREANVAKQASLLTVAFSISAIGGLLLSFALVVLGA